MKEINFWKFISDQIKKDFPVMLMIVAESSKSSPGRQGFKMAVSSGGELAGTVGGGIMEHNLVEKCREYLKNKENINLVKKLYHNKTSAGEKSGLICGGTETIIIRTLTAGNSDLVSGIITSFEKLEGGILQIDHTQISFNITKVRKRGIFFKYEADSDWTYKENTGFPETVYIIGSGHVGLAVSKIMSLLDFYVISIDSRNDVATVINNTYANKKLIIPYEKVREHIIEGDKIYAVIVTHGHDTDLASLKSIIHMNFAYLGMMGSKRKIKSVFNLLVESGVDPGLFDKVHSPIGLEIEAESPEEIAVSIAAEIIKIKNGSKPGAGSH